MTALDVSLVTLLPRGPKVESPVSVCKDIMMMALYSSVNHVLPPVSRVQHQALTAYPVTPVLKNVSYPQTLANV